jgi:hypothetical protein
MRPAAWIDTNARLLLQVPPPPPLLLLHHQTQRIITWAVVAR